MTKLELFNVVLSGLTKSTYIKSLGGTEYTDSNYLRLLSEFNLVTRTLLKSHNWAFAVEKTLITDIPETNKTALNKLDKLTNKLTKVEFEQKLNNWSHVVTPPQDYIRVLSVQKNPDSE